MDRGGSAAQHDFASPSSSTTSLPPVQAERPPPTQPYVDKSAPAQPSIVAAGNQQPVGLGLPTFVGDTGRPDWPVVRDLGDEHDSDYEDDHDGDQQEMDTYQFGHRAPVDAALRSTRGVVALGDGWAGGATPTPKRRWFKRNKPEQQCQAQDDPLALWNEPASAPATSAMANGPTPALVAPPTDPNAKWWRSRRNLFMSQKNIASPQEGSPALAHYTPQSSETRANASSAAKNRPSWVNRSRLHFGSMVDLGRHDKRRASTTVPPLAARSPTATATLTNPSGQSSGLGGPGPGTPKTKTFARHSMGGLVRNKARPHPLELSHQKDRAAASSQPVIPSASTSQPSFFPSPSHEHPLLRMAYARSESHLAGSGLLISPGIPPPRPVVENGSLKGTNMPTWRPPILPPPTTLVEVEEEEEEEEEHSGSGSGRPPLQRTATFGDDDPRPLQTQQATRPAHVVSQAPKLDTVHGSPPQATERRLPLNESGHESGKPNATFLCRIKNVLSRGRKTNSPVPSNGNKGNTAPHIRPPAAAASPAPESPRSYLSEQPLPTTPTRASLLPPPRSVGHKGSGVAAAPRQRSRLWSLSYRAEDGGGQDLGLATKAPSKLSANVDKRGYRVSRHVVESMINLSPSTVADTFGRASASSSNPSPNLSHPRRTSWTPGAATPARLGDEDNMADVRADRRLSRTSLRRLTSQSKQRPGLGSVFPRPPDSVEHPPSLHWALPGSYSTPMLHKFGGSTLSLALDISSQTTNNGGGGMSLADIQESPISPRRRSTNDTGPVSPAMQRDRAISATLTSLTARSESLSAEPPAVLQDITRSARGGRNSIPVNIDNLTNSSDSLSLVINHTVNFPLPPSSSGELSSPDPDLVEQLRTPGDGAGYDYYRDSASDSSGSSRSAPSRRVRKAPSWSTCKTSPGTSMTPIATPTSTKSIEEQQQRSAYHTAHGSYSSTLLVDAVAAAGADDTAAAYMAKAAAAVGPRQSIVA